MLLFLRSVARETLSHLESLLRIPSNFSAGLRRLLALHLHMLKHKGAAGIVKGPLVGHFGVHSNTIMRGMTPRSVALPRPHTCGCLSGT